MAKHKADWTWGDVIRKATLALAIAMCLGWSQWCGWSVTGTLVADSGTRRDVQAAVGGSASQNLLVLTKRKAEIAFPKETLTQLKAQLDLELRRKGKGVFADGDGPKATEIRGKIGVYDDAAKLDAEIAAATKALQGAPAVAGGDTDVAIPVGIVQRLGWVSEDVESKVIAADVRFWLVVFSVFAIGFFATFGPRLVGIRHEDLTRNIGDLIRERPVVLLPLIFLIVEAGMNATFGWRRAGGGIFNPEAYLQALVYAAIAVLGAFLPTTWDKVAPPAKSNVDAFLDQFDWGPRSIGSDLPAAPYMPDQQVAALREKLEAARGIDRGTPQPEGQPMPREPLSGGHPPPFPRSLDRASDAHPYGAPARDGAWGAQSFDPRLRHEAPANVAPQSAMHGAPIAIHNHFTGGPGAPGAAPVALQPVHDAGPHHGSHQRAQIETRAAPPLLTGPPVDRSSMREKVDQLLLFKAACLLDTPGGVVSGEAMYAAYAEWADVRALSQDAFLAVFSEFADVPTQFFAARPHFINVSLRGAQARAVRA